jgi:hypothetical protein
VKQLCLVATLFFALFLPSTTAGATSTQVKKFSYYHKATGVALTIGKSEYDTTGSGFNKPSKGMMYQMCYVIVANRGNQPRKFNPLDVTVVANNRKTYQSTTFLPGEYHQINLVTVRPHSSRAGWIGFQVPRKAKKLSVYWNDQYTLDPPVLIVSLYPK